MVTHCQSWEQCSKCEEYRHYNYQCSSESRHVRIAPSDNIDDSKVKDIDILPEITSIVEDALIDSSTLIIDEVHVSSDSNSDNVDVIVESDMHVDVIVESDILAKSTKSFEFSCADYVFIVDPTELSPSESSESLIRIQQRISGVFFLLVA